MQTRHVNRQQYFEEQGRVTEKYVIPYIASVIPVTSQTRVLEIGCGEGGNMAPFIRMGCETVGVDINARQINLAGEFLMQALPQSKVLLLAKDIYLVDDQQIGRFDLIMLRDVIEHIPQQERFFQHLKTFLKPGGKVFFGFPPWRMPFGGHQQNCRSRVLDKLPFFHLLPMKAFQFVLRLFGESEGTVQALTEIKETGIGIDRFERIVRDTGFQFDKKTYYLINPNYEIKFGLKPREQWPFLASIPYFRDFFTTCVYCVVGLKKG